MLALCTAEGGPTSHTAIFARTLGLPALANLGEEILSVEAGTRVLVDAQKGELVMNPDERVSAEFMERAERSTHKAAGQLAEAHAPAVTRDGKRVEIAANISNLESAQAALEYGAEGVGLLRTEFLYMQSQRLPSEEAQYQSYTAILDVFGTLPVILRTCDIGGDKELPYLGIRKEANPFLGLRGLRLALAHPQELLNPQLKAVLRAGRGHNLKVMFPMVAALSEIRQAREALEECKAELLGEGKSIVETLPLGIMVEVPSAALMADRLAAEVDFFSIGTNDLTQYTLAADRGNAELAYLSSGASPAVLRLIRHVTTQAKRYGKPVGVCGELAGEPLAIPILLGLGVDELSMNAPAIPRAKQIIRGLSMSECRRLAAEALEA